MDTGKCRKVTQREFFETARTHLVSYQYPGTFRAGTHYVDLKKENITRFLEKLSKAIPFKEYDELTREIWVSYMEKGRQGLDSQIFSPIEP